MDEEAIFAAALEIEAANQRAAYLDKACAGHADLRRKVEELLGAHLQAGNFLDNAAAAWNACLGVCAQPTLAEGPGTVIGPYKLLEQIGVGGMGLVFMAEQSRPVRRRVALKIVKPGMDTRQVVARFEAERQALALMDHQHIAKVFDAGATASGRPYFVMELVRGVPITDFCEQHRYTMRQCLELFITVCQAVQHAHQKGIIHRDLKPSNVLVTLHDTAAVPKIIDFGIAKATTEPLTERTMFTHFAQMVGTPLYMSPEQAEMNGLDVDTRSDVYALGVMLYELLTGMTPFESDTLKRVGLDEMRRMIREDEPPTPSRRLSTLGAQASSTISERRGVDGRRLRHALRQELDWIVMKALEKDRNRRYESASALAADLQRCLNDEPVEACPPSVGYRLRKFTRRNRQALVTAVMIALVLVCATGVSTWLAIDANEARQLADERLVNEKKAKQEATVEANIARAVNKFLQEDVLRQAENDPQDRDRFLEDSNLTVKEALDLAAARIGNHFQDQPLVEAAIRTVIGESYKNLLAARQAIPHLERAVALRKAHLGSDHPDAIASMNALSNAYLWVGRYADAQAMRRHILDCRLKALGPDHPATLACMLAVVEASPEGPQRNTSLPLLEQLVERQRTVSGPNNPATLGLMHHLAMNYAHAGRLTDSLAMHQKTLDGFITINGPENPATIWPRLTYAQACLRAGELDRGDRLLKEVLEMIQKSKNIPRWRTTRSNTLGWLALTKFLQHRYDEAESLIRETLAFHEKVHADSPRTFYWKTVLGAILLGQNRATEAEPLLLQGYKGLKQRETTDLNPLIELTEAGERVVRFYEATNQLDKARQWRTRVEVEPKGAAFVK